MRGFNELIEEFIKTEVDTMYKWVCDYQQSTGLNKALRNIKPVYVKITLYPKYVEAIKKYKKGEISIWELKCNEQYSIFPMKNGVLGKKEIGWYGNHSGDYGLHYFDNEKECNETYNNLIYDVIVKLELEKKKVVAKFDASIETLKESFIGSDYIMEKLKR